MFALRRWGQALGLLGLLGAPDHGGNAIDELACRLHALDRRPNNAAHFDHKRAEKLAKRNPKKERVRPAPAFPPAGEPVAAEAEPEVPAVQGE